MCPIIHSTSTCVRDIPRSLSSSSHELSPRLTQGNEVANDENILNTQDSSHPSSSYVLHEDDLLSQLAENFDEACDRDGFHPKRVLKLVTTTILKPCMISFTSQNEIF